MKKILSIALVIAMVLGCICTASAASSFTDITDESTANAVEVLRLMGVVDGIGDGTYNPSGTLTRSEFTKLAVASTHSDADFSKYKSMTIYPDVKADAWFAPYINMASKELKIILGCTDGLFHPEKTITAGEAVTILLRLIGFEDAEVGGVWPYGHFQFAKDLGMLSGTSIASATSTMTRADAAKLFVNSIYADGHQKNNVFHLSNETVLISVNQGAKQLRTKDGSYTTLKSINGNTLAGKAGYVVMDAKGNALSFLPKSVLYYNDEEANALSGTTISVYYESCVGSPAEPMSIRALGHDFEVLPRAISTLSNYKPGSHITLSLSMDGKVAAVSGSSNGNGVFVVSYDGSAHLICGGNVLDWGVYVDDAKLYGKAVKINYASKDKVTFTALSSSEGTLKVSEKKLGSKKITDGALVFNNGEISTLEDISSSVISYARKDSDGYIDLIVAADSSGGKLVAGKVTIENVEVGWDEEFDQPITEARMRFVGPDVSFESYAYSDDTSGFYIGNYNGTRLNYSKKLVRAGAATKEDFEGTSAVYINGNKVQIKSDVTCYNADLGNQDAANANAWTSLEEALAYGRSFTCYSYNNIIYLISYSY